MNRVVAVLVSAASIVVIAAGGLWLWQQSQIAQRERAEIKAIVKSQMLAASCGKHRETLELSARESVSVAPEARQAAIEGLIACRDAGIP